MSNSKSKSNNTLFNYFEYIRNDQKVEESEDDDIRANQIVRPNRNIRKRSLPVSNENKIDSDEEEEPPIKRRRISFVLAGSRYHRRRRLLAGEGRIIIHLGARSGSPPAPRAGPRPLIPADRAAPASALSQKDISQFWIMSHLDKMKWNQPPNMADIMKKKDAITRAAACISVFLAHEDWVPIKDRESFIVDTGSRKVLLNTSNDSYARTCFCYGSLRFASSIRSVYTVKMEIARTEGNEGTSDKMMVGLINDGANWNRRTIKNSSPNSDEPHCMVVNDNGILSVRYTTETGLVIYPQDETPPNTLDIGSKITLTVDMVSGSVIFHIVNKRGQSKMFEINNVNLKQTAPWRLAAMIEKGGRVIRIMESNLSLK